MSGLTASLFGGSSPAEVEAMVRGEAMQAAAAAVHAAMTSGGAAAAAEDSAAAAAAAAAVAALTEAALAEADCQSEPDGLAAAGRVSRVATDPDAEG